MARYFFHVENGSVHQDEDGVELGSLAAARLRAVKLAGQIIRDSAREFWDFAAWNMTVTNERGLTLFTLEMVATDAPAVRAFASH